MAVLFIAAAALAAWAVTEGRRQRDETAGVLAAQAALLARTLGPGLEAASTAAREVEEDAVVRILDNARLLAALQATGAMTPDLALTLAEQNDIASIYCIGRTTPPRNLAGETVPPPVLRQAEELLSGESDELLLGFDLEQDMEHIAAVVRATEESAVLVRAHVHSVRDFAAGIGVESLLRRLAGSEGVLYLGYSETPGDLFLWASWDGEEMPSESAIGVLRTVRSRDVFEAVVPVSAPAGFEAELRVGLDGGPLKTASVSAARRTTLVGIVLILFSLALVGIALLARKRALEQEAATRKMNEMETERRRSERLAAAGALTAGLAHEVRSPLNAISLAAQRIERNHQLGEECGRFAVKIRDEIGRLETILGDFLELASPVGQERSDTDLLLLTEGVVDLLGAEAESGGVDLVLAGDNCVVRADPGSVRRAVINLVRNAIQASPAGGTIEVGIESVDGDGLIRVLDEGAGVDVDLGERVFDAFVTTHAQGTGLGLALVRRVAEEHHGTVSLGNREGGGAVAEFRLQASRSGDKIS